VCGCDLCLDGKSIEADKADRQAVVGSLTYGSGLSTGKNPLSHIICPDSTNGQKHPTCLPTYPSPSFLSLSARW